MGEEVKCYTYDTWNMCLPDMHMYTYVQIYIGTSIHIYIYTYRGA